MTTTKTPMPESLSKRIEEMVETEALEKYPKIMLPSGGGGLKYDPNYPQRCAYKDRFKAGCKWMYQEMQATLSERDAEIERLNDTTSVIRSSLQSKIDFERNQNTRLKSQLKAAQEENEQLMNVEYWPDRYKIEAKKVEELKSLLAEAEGALEDAEVVIQNHIDEAEECRADEACDHCFDSGIINHVRETLTKIRGK